MNHSNLKLRLIVVVQKINHHRRHINLGTLTRPAMVMSLNLNMPQQIRDIMAGILIIRDAITQVQHLWLATAIPTLPAPNPVRNGRQRPAATIAAPVRDSRVAGAVDLHDGNGRPSRVARGIVRGVRVKGTRDGGKCGELAAMGRRAGQCSEEAGAVGVAGTVDSDLVDAVVVFDAVDEVRRKDFVTDAGRCVAGAFPVALGLCALVMRLSD